MNNLDFQQRGKWTWGRACWALHTGITMASTGLVTALPFLATFDQDREVWQQAMWAAGCILLSLFLWAFFYIAPILGVMLGIFVRVGGLAVLAYGFGALWSLAGTVCTAVLLFTACEAWRHQEKFPEKWDCFFLIK